MTFCMLGHSTSRILSQAEEMLRRCQGQKIKIGISLDGVGEDHDRLRGIPGLFYRAVATVRGLADLKRHYPNLRIDIGMPVNGLTYQTIASTAECARATLPVDVPKPILARGTPLNPD